MNGIWRLVQSEPVAAQGVVQTALMFACAFGLHLNPAQIAATLALSAAILCFFTRKSVTPNVKIGG